MLAQHRFDGFKFGMAPVVDQTLVDAHCGTRAPSLQWIDELRGKVHIHKLGPLPPKPCAHSHILGLNKLIHGEKKELLRAAF